MCPPLAEDHPSNDPRYTLGSSVHDISDETWETDLRQLRRGLLLSILESDLEDDVFRPIIAKVDASSDETIMHWYGMARDVLEQAETMEEGDHRKCVRSGPFYGTVCE